MASWKKVIVSGSKAVLAEVTASAGFSGDGSGLTGITANSVNIDGLSALGGAGVHQTEDHFMFSDNGTEKKITFSNLQDAVFADVSGDATIAAGGALTIANTSVENGMLANDGITIAGVDTSLGGSITQAAILAGSTAISASAGVTHDDTTGFVANEHIDHSGVTITAGDGLTGGGTIAATRTLAVGAGTGIDVAADAISVDVSDFMTNGANNRIVTATGTDAMNSEANLTFDGTNMVVTGNVTASAGITGSFVGDGSGLTGVTAAVDIDALSAVTSPHQTEDHFIISDNGTEKKISFTSLEDAIFANVSGDATVAAGGALTIAADSVENSMLANITRGSIKVGGGSNAPTDLDAKTSGQILVGDGTDIASVAVSGDIALASNGAMTIQANSVALGTDTTGNYVGTITGGDGITSTGATSGEGIGHSLSVDLSGLSSVSIGAGTSETTVNDNLTITGDLTVNGAQTIISTTNLSVEDKFITLASGSTAGSDGGIIVQSAAAGTGASFVWDTGVDRWALGKEGSVDDSATAVDATDGNFNYVVGVSGSTLDPTIGVNPTFGTNAASRAGQMHVNTTSGDIYIYS